MKNSIILLLLGLAAFAGYTLLSQNQAADLMQETETVVTTEDLQNSTVLRASLEDVSGGDASGVALVDYVPGTYMLTAEFQNLPELEDGYFYEGWIVRQGTEMSVLSTGPTQVTDQGAHLNIFESSEDLRDHALYVLTLEPDDGDPAPAAHVVEGMFK